MLIELAKNAFEKAGWPTEVQTGRYTFPLAENARNVQGTAGKNASNASTSSL